MASKTGTTPTAETTITDAQYKELLATRLAAMKGFEAGTVSEEDKNKARAAVRNARKVFKAEGRELPGHTSTPEPVKTPEQIKAESRSAAAKKAAATRKAKAAQKVNVPEGNGHRQPPEQVNSTTQVIAEVPAENAA